MISGQSALSENIKRIMQRKRACPALCALFLALSFLAEAQQPKPIQIGYLSALDRAGESSRAEGIQTALRELSYAAGQNIIIEYRYIEGNLERAPALAAELVRLNVDVILVAGGSGPIHAAKNATKTIPIVMSALSADPVEAGLVKSLARPGGNVTGLTTISSELGGNRVELLKEAVPKLGRVAVLYFPVPQSVSEIKEVLPIAARAPGLTIQPWEIRSGEGIEKVFAALNQDRPDGLYLTSGGLMNAHQKQIAGSALRSRLPSISAVRESVDAGGLIYYGADVTDTYRRVAYYVDKILRGAKPADLPVEQPSKFELIINLKTAKQIGLTIPPNVLARADKVIK